MKGHDAVIPLFEVENVDTVFTLMSEDTMHLMSKLEGGAHNGIQMIKTRHEQGAMAMADGYSRAGDRIGVCLVGRGPGVAQTGTAMVTARKKGSKVLVVVPEPSLSEEYDVKEFDQEQYLRSTIGDVVSSRSRETLITKFRNAMRRVKAWQWPVAV